VRCWPVRDAHETDRCLVEEQLVDIRSDRAVGWANRRRSDRQPEAHGPMMSELLWLYMPRMPS
jgi:hypothetical protein